MLSRYGPRSWRKHFENHCVSVESNSVYRCAAAPGVLPQAQLNSPCPMRIVSTTCMPYHSSDQDIITDPRCPIKRYCDGVLAWRCENRAVYLSPDKLGSLSLNALPCRPSRSRDIWTMEADSCFICCSRLHTARAAEPLDGPKACVGPRRAVRNRDGADRPARTTR